MRPKHWEVIPSKLWWSATVQVWGTHVRTVLQEHKLDRCSTALMPEVALKFAFTAAELGEVMLAWCHLSVKPPQGQLKGVWEKRHSRPEQKSEVLILAFYYK